MKSEPCITKLSCPLTFFKVLCWNFSLWNLSLLPLVLKRLSKRSVSYCLLLLIILALLLWFYYLCFIVLLTILCVVCAYCICLSCSTYLIQACSLNKVIDWLARIKQLMLQTWQLMKCFTEQPINMWNYLIKYTSCICINGTKIQPGSARLQNCWHEHVKHPKRSHSCILVQLY